MWGFVLDWAPRGVGLIQHEWTLRLEFRIWPGLTSNSDSPPPRGVVNNSNHIINFSQQHQIKQQQFYVCCFFRYPSQAAVVKLGDFGIQLIIQLKDLFCCLCTSLLSASDVPYPLLPPGWPSSCSSMTDAVPLASLVMTAKSIIMKDYLRREMN